MFGRVQVLTPQGEHIRNIGRSGFKEGELDHPVSAAVHVGMVYVTEANSIRVSVFKTTGEFVTTFGEGILSCPVCIAIDDSGFVYVTDNREKIVKF